MKYLFLPLILIIAGCANYHCDGVAYHLYKIGDNDPKVAINEFLKNNMDRLVCHVDSLSIEENKLFQKYDITSYQADIKCN